MSRVLSRAPGDLGGGGRDHRLDFFRGLCFVCLLIDHTMGGVLWRFTIRNYGFSDAADAFVLIAGISAALAYAGKQQSGKRIFLRTSQIYLTHIALSLSCAAILFVGSHMLGYTIFSQNSLHTLFTSTGGWSVLGLVTLTLQPQFLDVLPLYIIMLLWLPVILKTAEMSRPLALAISATVWVFAAVYQLNFSCLRPEGWQFNPFSWQFTLTIGVAVGLQLRRDVPLFSPVQWRAVLWAASLYLAFAFIYAAPWTRLPLIDLKAYHVISSDLIGPISKTYASGWRIAHVVCLMVVVSWCVDKRTTWLKSSLGETLCRIGRRPLIAFFVATIVPFFSAILFAAGGTGLAMQVVVNSAGLAALALVGGNYHGAWRAMTRVSDFGTAVRSSA